MILKEVYTRFYKSFNYDFLRKNNEKAKSKPWEMIEGKWYPYVRVPIHKDITTIVGANESGKSHLLTVIEKGISGENINREDFCRYSHFYTVEQGKRHWPDFGFLWDELNDEERHTIATACNLEGTQSFKKFYFFREDKSTIRIFIIVGSDPKEITLPSENAKIICDLLPIPFRIDANIALPSSVSISYLASEKPDEIVALGRQNRMDLVDTVLKNKAALSSEASIRNAAAGLASQISPLINPAAVVSSKEEALKQAAEFKLARDLICKVARIDPEALSELSRCIRSGIDGNAIGIVREINKLLEKALNFPHWWVQDNSFSLGIDAREHELFFTIRDRTGSNYSFGERSSGLKYFLSYYVQYLAHTPHSTRREILLMDEPDAYLSSQAQQDLLKIFHAFAKPEITAIRPIQVVYVTHSPFLIDRNHADRIRVLEKGSGDEGTRVVRNASRNHYEPLRSALGAFVAETTFIGNCNLVVEGAADQVLLAGVATFLKDRGATDFQTLDLNRLTIVPSGSAQHVPYLVYLARGRDYEKPAVIVLIDSDKEGNEAKATLLNYGPLKKLKLKKEFILQVGDVSAKLGKTPSGVDGAIETEDLIPLHISIAAVTAYFEEFDQKVELSIDLVNSKKENGKSIFKALEAACKAVDNSLHLDKVGFARATLQVVHAWSSMPDHAKTVAEFEESMKMLFSCLVTMRREALIDISQEKITQRVERAKDAFIQDHMHAARKEEALVLFDDITKSLGDEPESDTIKALLERLNRQFKLKEDSTKQIEDFESFKEQLKQIRYIEILAADFNGKKEVLFGGTINNEHLMQSVAEHKAT